MVLSLYASSGSERAEARIRQASTPRYDSVSEAAAVLFIASSALRSAVSAVVGSDIRLRGAAGEPDRRLLRGMLSSSPHQQALSAYASTGQHALARPLSRPVQMRAASGIGLDYKRRTQGPPSHSLKPPSLGEIQRLTGIAYMCQSATLRNFRSGRNYKSHKAPDPFDNRVRWSPGRRRERRRPVNPWDLVAWSLSRLPER